MTRRQFLASSAALAAQSPAPRPNILFAISDDQSWLHTSAAGDPIVKTPNFDGIAKSGVLFRNAFSTCPGCAPSRASILTGRSIWQLEEAGTHASLFPKKFTVFPDLLAQAGYAIGLTGKGAGPANYKEAGWPTNPAGPAFDEHKVPKGALDVHADDYAANFAAFLQSRPKEKPFFFWYGSHEPHRGYRKGSGIAAGKDPAKVIVPAFLPDTPEVRSDLLDYYQEIEYFDAHLGRMIQSLQAANELENTLILVCSDNGMSFPRAKANLYEYGIHLPAAVSWPKAIPANRHMDDLVSFRDFAPTFLEAAGLPAPPAMSGRSLLPALRSRKSGRIDPARTAVTAGRERHSHARRDNLGYPSRALRTTRYLYIRNFAPDLWPAGDPPLFADIDNGPSKTVVVQATGRFHDLSLAKRPAEELFDITKDPACLTNLATLPAHKKTLAALRAQLEQMLKAESDPRILGTGSVFDSYPRYSPMRKELGGFAEEGKYNPAFTPKP
ncbi:MAG TPA: sulfatase [Bryobacteraceae bacterium]|nr:sulfatase [Bryobacteraceae bacterium]